MRWESYNLAIGAAMLLLQGWEIGAYLTAYRRTGHPRYRSRAGFEAILGACGLFFLIALDAPGPALGFGLAAVVHLGRALANRLPLVTHSGYPDSRTLYLFGQPLPPSPQRGEGLFVPHADPALDPAQKRLLILWLIAITIMAIMVALVRL